MADIVFIHGMYMTGRSWEPWAARARAFGHTCHTPSWPHHDGEPAALRATLHPELGRLKFGKVIDHLKGFIDTLRRRPVLIGHSIGGLAVQKLVNDSYASAGVSISPAPPRGLLSYDPHFFRANFPHLNPFAGNKPVVMTKKRFHYTFCNTMSRADSDAAFDRYVVPESRNVPRSTLAKRSRVDFRAPHVPLLLVAAEHDHLTPQSLIRKNARAYRAAGSVVDYQEFAGRSHFICNQDGWEEVADFSFAWIARQPH